MSDRTRRIPVCDICSCLLRFEEFEAERCGPCERSLAKIEEILDDEYLQAAAFNEGTALRILQAITPVGLLHHEEEE